MTDSLGPFFEALADHEIPGGCGACDAVQVVSEVRPGVWLLDVRHDEWCPVLRSRTAKSN